MTRPQLEIQKLSKHFEKTIAVSNIDLTIEKGEIFALLGGSGCGKSTLLRMLAGFETPSQGSITLNGKIINAVPAHKRPVNMMFQSYALFPHMSVFNNIAFGLKQDGLSKKAIKNKVEEMLDLVRMHAYSNRKPHQLSGGQQQRVALARCLAKSPELLLLDEPLGALDKKLRNQMQLEIVDIIEALKVTCVMVTHDQEEAMTMADRIGIMDEGKIIQIGKPMDIYEQPNSRLTAEFIGNVNIFEGVLSVDEPDRLEISCEELTSPILVNHGITGIKGMPLSYAIRPEKLSISKQKPQQDFNLMKGVIEDIAYLGNQSIYHVILSSGKKVAVSIANTQRFFTGHESEQAMTWKDHVYLYFNQDSGVVLTE